MRTHRLVLCAALPLAVLLAMASPAFAAGAADSAAAEALFPEATQLIAAGDFEHACPKLAESHPLAPGGSPAVEATGPGYRRWSMVVTIANDGPGASVEVPALEKLPVEAAPGGPAASAPAGTMPAPFVWRAQRVAGVGVAGAGVLTL